MIAPITIWLDTGTCGYKGNGVTWNAFVEIHSLQGGGLCYCVPLQIDLWRSF